METGHCWVSSSSGVSASAAVHQPGGLRGREASSSGASGGEISGDEPGSGSASALGHHVEGRAMLALVGNRKVRALKTVAYSQASTSRPARAMRGTPSEGWRSDLDAGALEF